MKNKRFLGIIVSLALMAGMALPALSMPAYASAGYDITFSANGNATTQWVSGFPSYFYSGDDGDLLLDSIIRELFM